LSLSTKKKNEEERKKLALYKNMEMNGQFSTFENENKQACQYKTGKHKNHRLQNVSR
jgi:hypothetical protein